MIPTHRRLPHDGIRNDSSTTNWPPVHSSFRTDTRPDRSSASPLSLDAACAAGLAALLTAQK